MVRNRIITENQLDEWVRGNSRDAQGVIVELVYRLVAASSPKPKERRFPLGDSIGQPGPDGVLETDIDFDPFVPEGKSFWEIGTGIGAGKKATSDYRDLTKATPAGIRSNSVFVFITPLSGRRDWQHTWKEEEQADWLKRRRDKNEWRDVRVIDGSVLIDWLSHFPAVEYWLAGEIGIPIQQIETPEQYWDELKSIGEPPPLTPHVFLVNRDEACKKLEEVFTGTILQLKIDTRFPNQVPDFVAAYLASLDDSSKVDALGRCLVVSGRDAWSVITSLRDPHVLIADFELDESDSAGTKLLQKARRSGHAVIFSGMSGGIPHPTRVNIPNPKSYQVKEALEKAGYKEERARTLSEKSNGNLNSLLRCLQNLSLAPEWAQGTDAAELVISELLGSWDESFEADKESVEELSGKVYGEWIGLMRDLTLRPGTPLVQRNGVWKVVARYEGWYALGPRVFDEHLDRFKEIVVNVLSERDPQFELDKDKRYTAGIYGKNLRHSTKLRNGLAESLALIGSHSKALSSCSIGKAETIAVLSLREIFENADWQLWASLNSYLPMFAEAAPEEFLNLVESTVNTSPENFDEIFNQEGDGLTGGNYITGLLWALETLAWDENYLTRVVVILGDLAARDPGGRWANRPQNSLSTIFLPWFPQTCSPISKKRVAIETLFNEQPDVAWSLLMTILPNSHQTTSGSHKPVWREIIPDDWSSGVTNKEYWEQTSIYTELAVSIANQSVSKLVEMIDRLGDLSPPAREHLLNYMRSEEICSLPPEDINRLWTEMTDFVTKHRKHADTDWALKPEVLNEIEDVTDRLSPKDPFYEYQRLFRENDHNLYEEIGNWQEQSKALETRRTAAIKEIFSAGGVDSIVEFSKLVKSPWRVGVSFGLGVDEADDAVLPVYLESENKSLIQLAGGYVWGRFRSLEWDWVDCVDVTSWSSSQVGQFFSYLPFDEEAWRRVRNILGRDEHYYWKKTNANAYDTDAGLEAAIDKLVEYGRPHEAVECLERLRYDNKQLDNNQIVRVLDAVLASPETANRLDAYHIVELIKVMQDNPATNQDDLFHVEWAYLKLLDRRFHDASPKLLEQRLADDPEFFCEVLRLVFRSKNDKDSAVEPDEQKKNIATNAYHLLSEWRTPPGSIKDNGYDGVFFKDWLTKVIAICEETGHLEVGLTMIGHVLIHSPADPSGLWIHKAPAEALNDKHYSDMRDGFRSASYNSRGVHWVDPEGKPEMELAEKYKIKAEQVEDKGYHRFASALRTLAVSYEKEAERIISRRDDDD